MIHDLPEGQTQYDDEAAVAQSRASEAGANLTDELAGYCENVLLYLAMEQMDEYCTRLCAYYMNRNIPPSVAAANIRRALLPANAQSNPRSEAESG